MNYFKFIKYFKYFFYFLFIIINTNNLSYANIIYKHTIPFTVKMKKEDILNVSYDFSARNGIHCVGKGSKYQINVIYKGHQKLLPLPITLQSQHIPSHLHEVLADTMGKFMIEIVLHNEGKNSEVSCDYL
jgi:hypothetical protein